jgi:hypothetical protein
MKVIFENIFNRKVSVYRFKQYIYVYPKQYKDNEIYETEVDVQQPQYIIDFEDGGQEVIELEDLLVIIYNSKK